MKSYGNGWSRLAASLTAMAHKRAPHFRWGVLLLLAAVWLVAGYVGWIASDEKATPLDSIYRTVGALTVQDSYGSVPNWQLELARYAGALIPLVGLIFAFSGQLGASLARLFSAGAANHIVICGDGPAALTLARDCAGATKQRRKKDVVCLIAHGLPDETIYSLGHAGVLIVSGDPTGADALRAARADFAAHVVALAEDDTANLRIEAAVRAAAARRKRKKKLTVHLGLRSPILLQEARQMRQLQGEESRVESAPFSLDELAARILLTRRGAAVMGMAEKFTHQRPHLVMFGFDDAAEAVAVRALMSLWSARFGAPCITVVTQEPDKAKDRFEARYPNARAHDIWQADIEFRAFDWRLRSVDEDFLRTIHDTRGQASFIVVSTGSDSDNIALALGVVRACNDGLADVDGKALWPVPIFMKEASESEFSRQFAGGDKTPNVDDAFLEAFGGVERVAAREIIIEGSLDAGAAMAHEFYQRSVEKSGVMAPRELEAVRRSWNDVGETYRNANRAVADHAMMKLWDLGWRAAGPGEKGEHSPEIPEADIQRLAELEHTRWMAERMMSGWRPGAKRDNRLRVHPNIVPWSQLTDTDKAKDAEQVRGALTLARAMHKEGFVRRGAAPMA